MGIWSSRNSVKKLDKPNASTDAIGTADSISAGRTTAATSEDSGATPSVSAGTATSQQGSGELSGVSAADHHLESQNISYSKLSRASGQSPPGLTAPTSSVVLSDESLGLRDDIANAMQLPSTLNCLVEGEELEERREAGKQDAIVEKDKENVGMGVYADNDERERSSDGEAGPSKEGAQQGEERAAARIEEGKVDKVDQRQGDQAEPISARSSPSVQSVDETSRHPTASALLVAAVENEDWKEAERLLQSPQPLDPNARTGDWGYALLRAAAEEGALGTCRLLLERRATVNARDQNGMTPLMGCIVGGDHRELVSLLLEAAADAAAVTDDGFSALKWATRLNRESAIILLREKGMTGSTTCF